MVFRNKRMRGGRKAKAQSLNIACFLVTDPGSLPPASETQWFHIITAVAPSPADFPADSPAVSLADTSADPPSNFPELSSSSSKSQELLSSSSDSTASSSLQSCSPALLSQVHSHQSQSHSIPLQNQTYFQSKEAHKVFGYSAPKNNEERDKDVRDIIYQRIERFQNGVYTFSGWRQLMEDGDKENKCGERFVCEVRNKAKYLFHALTILLEKKEDESTLSWQQICDLAAEKVKEFEGAGVHASNSNKTTHWWVGGRTIMRWFQIFRDNKENFINTPYHTSQIDKYPSISHHSKKNSFCM